MKKQIPKPQKVESRLDIKVGFSCNNLCRFCVQGEKRKHYRPKTKEEVFEILEKNTSYTGIVFTGGEPALHPHLLEMIIRARQLGYRYIQVQTNGRMFAYRDFCRKVIDAGATEISPALHGHCQQLHDYLTRSPGSYQQTITGIKNLKAFGVKVVTNTVITRSNFRNLEQIAQLLVRLDVDQYQLAFVHPVGSAGEGANFESVVPRFEMIMPYVYRALEVGIAAGKVVMTEAIPYCFMNGYEDYIAEKVIPDTRIFDAEQTIEDYRKYRLESGKARGEPCLQCKKQQWCEGPWREYPEKFGWEEFKPIT